MTSTTKPTPRAEAGFDARAFRDALGRFATGVCIVTALDREGGRLGMTVNSFSSVSLAPPLVLFSIARGCYGFEHWMAAGHYGVNVLAADQTELSNRFARALSDKWAGLRVETGVTGVPLLPGAIARFECEARDRHDGGDHAIFVARVARLEVSPRADPLVFFAGSYRNFSQEPSAPVPPDAPLFYGW